MTNQSQLLGDYTIQSEAFPRIEKVLAPFRESTFLKLSARKRYRAVNEALVALIQEAPRESYLLPSVVDYITRVNGLKVLDEKYHFTLFEFWINHYEDLTPEENYLLRAKIAGKHLPREDYQVFFPIGMSKTYTGTHFVASHLSPDVDTMIASFWGWVDAFAARVSDGMHIWSLPGGPPDSPVSQIFRQMLGAEVFPALSRTATSQTLCAMDLVTKTNLVKEKPGISISTLDHGFNEKAVILVDESGHYCGDWRSNDVEPVRQIIILFKSCLRWFETNLYSNLISLFAKKEMSLKDIPGLIDSVFEVPIESSEPVQEFSENQRRDLEAFLVQVLNLEKGSRSSFAELNSAFEQGAIQDLTLFRQELEALNTSDLFDEEGKLIEDRSAIFNAIQKIFKKLDKAIHRIRDYVEGLEIVMQIKSKVLNKKLHYLTLRSDVEDIRIKMSNYNYLTVVVPEENGKLYPLGIVWAADLRKSTLGTISFRDFSNFEEVKMASYLSVISIVDHHKSALKTNSPAMALIGDAQSCNVLVAEETLRLNQKYSLGGISPEQIASQLKAASSQTSSPAFLRITQKLLLKQMAVESAGPYFVHPKREMMEYLCFLHAILDDTDLLTKVSNRDVICVANLLNAMKTLAARQVMEIVSLYDIPKDQHFAHTAAKRILKQEDMYSLYRRIYAFKEQEVSDNLRDCAEGSCTSIFSDTKEQNGCCRIGQMKLFSSNIPLFLQNRQLLQRHWRKIAEEICKAHPEIDLHLQMVSTIPSAEEVYNDKVGHYAHQDELWIWIDKTEQAQNHLASFLSAFQTAPELASNNPSLELPHQEADSVAEIFLRNFPPIPKTIILDPEALPVIVMKYQAGSLNSRKAMISPYLPRLVN